jgi:hypothetical protein
VVKQKTNGQETHGNSVVKQGKLWGMSSEHNASEEEEVARDEYQRAWEEFEVSSLVHWSKRQLIVSPQAAEKPTPQDHGDELRLARTMAVELEEAKTKAEEMAVEERRKADEERRRADEERKKALTLEHEVQKLREMLKQA